jgi:hypothetical protein
MTEDIQDQIASRNITMATESKCSTEGCPVIHKNIRKSVLTISRGWFDSDDQNAAQIPFTDLEDAVRTQLLQPDDTRRPCKYCGENRARTLTKDLSCVNLPNLLVVAIMGGMELSYTERLSLGDVTYELTGVGFKTPGHYGATVKLPTQPSSDVLAEKMDWFTFDDLAADKLKRATSFSARALGRTSYPRVWYYVRTGDGAQRRDNLVDLSAHVAPDRAQYFSRVSVEEEM